MYSSIPFIFYNGSMIAPSLAEEGIALTYKLRNGPPAVKPYSLLVIKIIKTTEIKQLSLLIRRKNSFSMIYLVMELYKPWNDG